MNDLLVALIFWISAGFVFYVFVGYPLLIAVLAKLFGRPPKVDESRVPRSVSVVISAFNEERTLDRRLSEFERLIAESGLQGEVIVVSDGSTDRTVSIAREQERRCGVVRTIELDRNQGKAVALSTGCAAAKHEVIVFADARQTWAADALTRLLAPLSDPTVGAVSGDLVIESSSGVMAGVGLYWRYEKWLRANEGRLHSTVGATGAISCVRRELFRPIPPGTILDDVWWPLGVVMQGKRVVHTPGANAFDRLPEKTKDEFRRKVRTLAGNFQIVATNPATLLPWRNPIWIQFLSHKLGRLAAPWALIALFASGLILSLVGSKARWFYEAATLGQAVLYAFGLLGVAGLSKNKLASVASSFLVLNSAAWISFWVWISGRAGKSWGKVSYRSAPRSAAS